ncbi:MAG: type 4a pilus biogenesis protein PilO [Parcubacteria group bacterium]
MIIRMLLFPVILLLVLYFVIALVVPTSRSISTEKKTVVQKKEMLAKAQEKQKNVNAFVDTVKSHPEEKSFVMDFVPNDQREEIILSDISQLAEKSGVSLFSVGFSEGRQDVRSSAAADQQAYLIEGKMIASGTYEEFKKFSYELFHLKRLYAFKTLELTKVEKEKSEGGAAVDMQQEQMLSGVISFAYGYIPGQAQVNPSTFDQKTDFDSIDTVMKATAQTNPLVSQSTNRPNPFLP